LLRSYIKTELKNLPVIESSFYENFTWKELYYLGYPIRHKFKNILSEQLKSKILSFVFIRNLLKIQGIARAILKRKRDAVSKISKRWRYFLYKKKVKKDKDDLCALARKRYLSLKVVHNWKNFQRRKGRCGSPWSLNMQMEIHGQ
jgi:hypothetical protein